MSEVLRVPCDSYPQDYLTVNHSNDGEDYETWEITVKDGGDYNSILLNAKGRQDIALALCPEWRAALESAGLVEKQNAVDERAEQLAKEWVSATRFRPWDTFSKREQDDHTAFARFVLTHTLGE